MPVERWVNLTLEVIVASEDITVDSSRAEKTEALDRLMDELTYLLEAHGFQAKYEPVLAGQWDDVEHDTTPRSLASRDQPLSGEETT